jgi:hypothetical protein
MQSGETGGLRQTFFQNLAAINAMPVIIMLYRSFDMFDFFREEFVSNASSRRTLCVFLAIESAHMPHLFINHCTPSRE